MFHIKNWSIRTRVLLVFLVILIPFLGFTGIAARHYGTLMHSYMRTQEEATDRLRRASDVMAAVDQLMLTIEAYVAGAGRQEERQVTANVAQLQKAFDALRTDRFRFAEERELIEKLGRIAFRMETLGREIVTPAPFPANHEAPAKANMLHQLHDSTGATLHQLMDIYVREIGDATRRATDVGHQVIVVTLVTLIISGVVAIGISVPLAHWLSGPIQAIAFGSRRLTEGDLSHRVETSSGGELGEAAQAFNVMAERLERSAIENAALYGAARERAERILAVNRLTKIISASLDIGAVFETFAQELKRFIPYTRMGIVMVEESGRRFRLFQLVGERLNKVPMGMVWSNGSETGVEWVIANKLPHFEQDLKKGGRFIEDEALVKEGIRSTARLPLMVAEQVMGVLFLDDIAPGRYAERDLKLLVPLGEQLAIAIENARLHDELEQRVAERTRALQQTQAQLIQSGKLAAVGTLAAGVAHELNQPLMIIRGYAQELLRDGRVADAELRDDLGRIEAQTTRMAAIINHLRDFSRQSRGKREAADLNRIVSDSLTFLGQQLATGHINVARELDAALPTIWADPLQIEQVLLNLITNARDAMESAGMGVITIRTERAPGNRVVLSVTDTGPGVVGDIQSMIFDPFFTTKEVGKGTGLGLSICHGIIEEHGGQLKMESPVADGRGARFTIVLPCGRPDDRKGDGI